jgi:hypothetical protein
MEGNGDWPAKRKRQLTRFFRRIHKKTKFLPEVEMVSNQHYFSIHCTFDPQQRGKYNDRKENESVDLLIFDFFTARSICTVPLWWVPDQSPDRAIPGHWP